MTIGYGVALRGIVVLILLGATSCASTPSLGGLPDGDRAPDFAVRDNERAAALDLLAASPSFLRDSQPAPVYLVDVEVVNDKEAPDNRVLLLRHYRTQGDVAIVSHVDLTRRSVTSEAIPHLPVPLSREEFEIASKLALARPEVQELIAGRRVEFQAQLARAADREDPMFGHRVVHLLLRAPEGYLEARVRVDLTAEEVAVLYPREEGGNER